MEDLTICCTRNILVFVLPWGRQLIDEANSLTVQKRLFRLAFVVLSRYRNPSRKCDFTHRIVPSVTIVNATGLTSALHELTGARLTFSLGHAHHNSYEPACRSPSYSHSNPTHRASMSHLLLRQRWLFQHKMSFVYVIVCFPGWRANEKSFHKALRMTQYVKNELYSYRVSTCSLPIPLEAHKLSC